MVIDMHAAETCPWCERGCVEVLASGTAIARRGAKLAADGRAPVLARLAIAEGEVTSEMMSRAVAEGDEVCRETFREAGRYLGIGLANYVNIFNPEAIVVGGGVSRSGPEFLEAARERMYAHAIRALSEEVRLEPAGLGERSGPMGMIARMAEMAQESPG
jgi:glucokinase